tara:strand:+ start:464 stop:808 length:345 start_codon:yes stop_codon:yes gene_type:complete
LPAIIPDGIWIVGAAFNRKGNTAPKIIVGGIITIRLSLKTDHIYVSQDAFTARYSSPFVTVLNTVGDIPIKIAAEANNKIKNFVDGALSLTSTWDKIPPSPRDKRNTTNIAANE